MKIDLRPVILISALASCAALGAAGCEDNASRTNGRCNCTTGESCSAADLVECEKQKSICDCATGKTAAGNPCSQEDLNRCEGSVVLKGCNCDTGEGCTEEQLAICNQDVCDCTRKVGCSTAQLAACPDCDCETGNYCSVEELDSCVKCDCMTKTNCDEVELAGCPPCNCKTKRWCSTEELAACPKCDCMSKTNCTKQEEVECPACDCSTYEYCSQKDKIFYCGQCDCLTGQGCSDEEIKICEDTQCDCETAKYCTKAELDTCPDQQKRECDCKTGEDCYEDEWAECTKGTPDLCNCVTREGCTMSSLSRCPRRFFMECEYNKDCEEHFVCKDKVCVPAACRTNETVDEDCGPSPNPDVYWWTCWEGFCHLNGGGSSPHTVQCRSAYDCADQRQICMWGSRCGVQRCECKTDDCDKTTRCFSQDNYCSSVDSICKRAGRFVRIDDMSPTCDMSASEELNPDTGEHIMRCTNEAPGARIDGIVIVDKDNTEHLPSKVIKYYRADGISGKSEYVGTDPNAIIGEPNAFVNYKASKDCRYYEEGSSEEDKNRATTFVSLGGKGGYIVAQFDSHTFIGTRTKSIKVLELGACNLIDKNDDFNTGKDIRVSVSSDGESFTTLVGNGTPNEKNYGVLQWDRQYADTWKAASK